MPADIVIHNGALMTFDDAQPNAAALAIGGGKITHVGTDAEVMAQIGPDTRVIDAQGGTVLPGFIDSHVHLFGGSVELEYLNLYGVKGLDEMRRLILPYSDAHPHDPLLFCVPAH